MGLFWQAGRSVDKTRQHQAGLGVAGRGAGFGGLAPGQPLVVGVLARAQRDAGADRHHQAKQVLGVVDHAGLVAVAPARIDLVDVLQAPVQQGVTRRSRIDTGLLRDLAQGGGFEGLPEIVLGARDRLPVVLGVSALDQQHLECRGVDHHQHGLRNLVDG